MSTSNFRAWMARRNSWRAWTSIAAEDALCAVKASKMLLLISILAIGGQMLTALLIPHLLFGQISAKATLSDAVVVLAFSCSPFYCSFSDLLQSFCFLTNKTNSRSTTTVVKSRFCKIQSSSPTRSSALLIQIRMIATAHRSWKISAPLSEILRSLMVRQSLAKSGLRTTRSHRQLVLSSLCPSLWSTVYFVSLCRRLRLSKDITLSLSDWRPPSQKCGLFSLSTRPSSLLLSTISFRRMALSERLSLLLEPKSSCLMETILTLVQNGTKLLASRSSQQLLSMVSPQSSAQQPGAYPAVFVVLTEAALSTRKRQRRCFRQNTRRSTLVAWSSMTHATRSSLPWFGSSSCFHRPSRSCTSPASSSV